jgi:hypothetical protein
MLSGVILIGNRSSMPSRRSSPARHRRRRGTWACHLTRRWTFSRGGRRHLRRSRPKSQRRRASGHNDPAGSANERIRSPQRAANHQPPWLARQSRTAGHCKEQPCSNSPARVAKDLAAWGQCPLPSLGRCCALWSWRPREWPDRHGQVRAMSAATEHQSRPSRPAAEDGLPVLRRGGAAPRTADHAPLWCRRSGGARCTAGDETIAFIVRNVPGARLAGTGNRQGAACV